MKSSLFRQRLVVLSLFIVGLCCYDLSAQSDNNASAFKSVTFQLMGQCEPAGQWFDIQGNFVYMTKIPSGFDVIDISDLNNPGNIYSFDCGVVFEIAVEEDYAYLTSGNGGIVIVNIRQP